MNKKIIHFILVSLVLLVRPLSAVVVYGQDGPAEIGGQIVDSSGEPVIGAAILVKGTTVGTVADFEGKFSLTVPAPADKAVLDINCIGFVSKEVPVGNSKEFNIVLEVDNLMLEDVVVVGYTPMRKSDFTGSIASVKSDELLSSTPTMAQALAGKVAGVEVRQTTGAPGAGVSIRVRGVNSLSAGSEPLYVIDGYPASEDVFINPSDIESIDVLKDAASAAIYGSRGASGVVLITTKRGKDGDLAKITYDFSYGIQQLDHKVDLLNAEEYRDFYIHAYNEAYRRRCIAAGYEYSPYDDNTIRAARGFSLSEVGLHPMFYDFTTLSPVPVTTDTDWQDELYSNAGMMRHNVTITGGSKAIKYMASIGYMDQDGIISPSNHKRLNARLNLDAQITKTIKASVGYSMSNANTREVNANGRYMNDGIVQSALMILPNLPAYKEDGTFVRSQMIEMQGWGFQAPENPMAIAHELNITDKSVLNSLNVKLDFEPVKNLVFSARLGEQWYSHDYNFYRPISLGRNTSPAYDPALSTYNIARDISNGNTDKLGEFTVNYSAELGKHHLSALVGYTMQRKDYKSLGAEATGFEDDRVQEVTAHGPDGTDLTLYSTQKESWAMMSFLGRVNWSYSNRYTATATFRADGSSRFGPENRWGYFPSVSAGWTLSNEPFLKDALNKIASIRLRASWGRSGNNNIGNYAHISDISKSSYTIGTTAVSTSRISGFADTSLGWETTNQTNVGIDLGFLDNRINFIANWYNSISTDILYSQPISSISGFTSSTKNMNNARIRNRGVDLQLDARILTGEVQWNVSTNISINRNKVLSLGGIDDILSTSERSVQSHITKEGYPIGSFYGYQVLGIMSESDYRNALMDRDVYVANDNSFPEGYVMKGPAVSSYDLADLSYGNIIWQDTNHDGLITEADKTILGDAYPDFTGGFSTNLSWKGLDFAANFTYSCGAQLINFQDYYLYNMEGGGNQYSIVNDRYMSDDNPGKNNVPAPVRFSTSNTSNKLPSYYVEDASYFRCSNITLGYTLPKGFLEKIRVKNCRVYISGDNLFTITPYRGYNPEVSYKSGNLMPGFDWGMYPLARIWTAGFSITF